MVSPYEYLKCDIEIYYAPLCSIYIKKNGQPQQQQQKYIYTHVLRSLALILLAYHLITSLCFNSNVTVSEWWV